MLVAVAEAGVSLAFIGYVRSVLAKPHFLMAEIEEEHNISSQMKHNIPPYGGLEAAPGAGLEAAADRV